MICICSFNERQSKIILFISVLSVQFFFRTSSLLFHRCNNLCVFLQKCRGIMIGFTHRSRLQTRDSAFVQETSTSCQSLFFFIAPSVSADVNCSLNPLSPHPCVQKPHPAESEPGTPALAAMTADLIGRD